jgi:UDP-3-O-[3-hydroxymyristoyl] N-acetylglucosamine deacetylase
MQTTLRRAVTREGIGVHSGAPARIVLHPAEAGTGVQFLRTGLPGGQESLVPALREAVGATELCTVIANAQGVSVSTVEHLMAALAGLGVDNVLVEIDGPELPIMDGSSRSFVDAIDEAEVIELPARRRVIKVLKPVRVENGRAWAELKPREKGFSIDVEIDFDTPVIGRQRGAYEITAASFRREISHARTFGFMKDVEFLWKKNLARGASLDNTVAIADDAVLNPEGLRYPDEFVRHKILDAVGDLALAGARIEGAYRAYCAGHKLNFLMLQALFADRSAWRWVEASAQKRRGARALDLMVPQAVFAADKT